MISTNSLYHGYRYPREIISHAVWLYYKFGLSLRNVEDLLAKRGVVVSDKTIRHWCRKFGLDYVRRLRRALVHESCLTPRIWRSRLSVNRLFS
jgi:putative transposase